MTSPNDPVRAETRRIIDLLRAESDFVTNVGRYASDSEDGAAANALDRVADRLEAELAGGRFMTGTEFLDQVAHDETTHPGDDARRARQAAERAALAERHRRERAALDAGGSIDVVWPNPGNPAAQLGEEQR